MFCSVVNGVWFLFVLALFSALFHLQLTLSSLTILQMRHGKSVQSMT